MYGVRRTTVHLPDHLKAALERVAASEQRTEAELVREGVRMVTERHATPAPRLPLFTSGDPSLAERVDETLAE
jgi:Arc/MetJ-type ribon-helix-helix transcriptional regulator